MTAFKKIGPAIASLSTAISPAGGAGVQLGDVRLFPPGVNPGAGWLREGEAIPVTSKLRGVLQELLVPQETLGSGGLDPNSVFSSEGLIIATTAGDGQNLYAFRESDLAAISMPSSGPATIASGSQFSCIAPWNGGTIFAGNTAQQFRKTVAATAWTRSDLTTPQYVYNGAYSPFLDRVCFVGSTTTDGSAATPSFMASNFAIQTPTFPHARSGGGEWRVIASGSVVLAVKSDLAAVFANNAWSSVTMPVSGLPILTLGPSGEILALIGAAIYSSTDGVSWIRVSTLPTSVSPTASFVVSQGYYIVCDRSTTLYQSRDLQVWDTITVPIVIQRLGSGPSGVAALYTSRSRARLLPRMVSPVRSHKPIEKKDWVAYTRIAA